MSELTQRPSAAVAVLCAVQLILWTGVPALVSHSLPLDVIEGYLWGREWVIATYKHPALPSWVLEISRIVTGRIGWPAYLVSQLFICATFAIIYGFGRDIMDARSGAAAAFLSTGIFFFTWSSPEFNHNVAQMPFWIGFVWALWRATRSTRIMPWLVTALMAIVCLYTKLSCAILLLAGGIWILWEPTARKSLATPGPWCSAALFLVAAAPLFDWLWGNDFLPLDYAERRANSAHAVTIPSFLLGQLGRHIGFFALLACAGLIWDWRIFGPERKPPLDPAQAAVRRYLFFMAGAPLVILLLIAATTGMHLKTAWTASMATLSGLVAVCLLQSRLTSLTYRRLVSASFALTLVVVTIYALDAVVGTRAEERYRPQQSAWPAGAIADAASAAWARATPLPLRIVIGETRIAGYAALKAGSLPSLMTDGDLVRSPWITPERLQRQGALLVWAEPGGFPGERMRKMAAGRAIEHVAIPWPMTGLRAQKRPPLNLYLSVLPPAP